MNPNFHSDLSVVLLILGVVLLFVGVRAVQKKRILKGRSSTEYLREKKAAFWGWLYTILGIILGVVSIILMI